MAGSIPIRRNRNGRNRPRVVATIIAENIASPNAKIIRIGATTLSILPEFRRKPQAEPPIIPQLIARGGL
jgi:hypothetical protein